MAMRIGRLVAIACLTAAPAVEAQENNSDSLTPSVRVSGKLALGQVDAAQRVSFQLTLTNGSSGDVADLRVARVGGPHITLIAADWCAGLTWTELTSAQCIVARSLAPGQSVTVSGAVFAERPVRANVTATVEWSAVSPAASDSRHIRSRAALSLGELVVEDWRVRWMGAASDFALPLVVFLLGVWFQWRLKNVEDSRQREAAERAEKAEAWRLMLPVSHRYAIRHYLGLEQAARKLVIRGGALVGSARHDEPTCEDAFHAWLLLHARFRMLQRTGAYYFKNHVGELLVPGLSQAYRQAFVHEADPRVLTVTSTQMNVDRLLDRAVAGMRANETKDSLLSKLAYARVQGGPLVELYLWFGPRFARPGAREALNYLNAYASVLVYELNRPYMPWFDDNETNLTLEDQDLVAIWRMLRFTKDTELLKMRESGAVRGYLRKGGIGGDVIDATWVAAQLSLPPSLTRPD